MFQRQRKNDPAKGTAAANTEIAEVVNGLWIGSLAALKLFDKTVAANHPSWTVISLLGSDQLINLSKVLISSSPTLLGCHHEIWQLSDSFQGDFLCPRLDEVLNLIDKSINERKECLVHCSQGISRSAALCTAWLISRKNMSLQEALDTLRNARPVVNPNLGFIASLRALEQCGSVHEAIQRMEENKDE